MASLYGSAPYGGVEQGDFVNSAMELRTLLSPSELLAYMQQLENSAGRERKLRWGPRTLDLDLLFYDDLILEDPVLIVPHPDMANRDFVLMPLCELRPGYRHPVSGQTVGQMLERLREKGEVHVMDRRPWP